MSTQFFKTAEEYTNFRGAWKQAVNSSRAKKTFKPCHIFKYNITKGTIIEGWKPVSGSEGYAWVSEKPVGKERIYGWITGEHHLLYNILRGKPLHTGFSPISNTNKLNPYISNMHNFYDVVRVLNNIIEASQALIKDEQAIEKLKKEHSFVLIIDKLRSYLQDSKDAELLKEDTGFNNLVEKLRTYLKKRPTGLLNKSTKLRNERIIKNLLKPLNGTVTKEMLAKIDAEQLQMIIMFDRQQKANYWLAVQ